jgi:signal transduction histidine kinase
VEQIITQLVSNALRHGDEESPVVVSLDGSRPESVTISVQNGGAAIPGDVVPQLFEPFEVGPRPPETPRRQIGLGLFLVKRFVTAHGGSVTLRSTPDEGTLITVVLPRSAPPVTAG